MSFHIKGDNSMKKIILFIFISFILLLTGCSFIQNDEPFWQRTHLRISNKYELVPMMGAIGFYEISDDSNNKLLLFKNIVVYCLKDNRIFLCELKTDGDITIWVYCVDTEHFEKYSLDSIDLLSNNILEDCWSDVFLSAKKHHEIMEKIYE